jgi:hypothetical protein
MLDLNVDSCMLQDIPRKIWLNPNGKHRPQREAAPAVADREAQGGKHVSLSSKVVKLDEHFEVTRSPPSDLRLAHQSVDLRSSVHESLDPLPPGNLLSLLIIPVHASSLIRTSCACIIQSESIIPYLVCVVFHMFILDETTVTLLLKLENKNDFDLSPDLL